MNDNGEPTSLAAGVVVFDSIDQAGAIDLYSVELSAGEVYIFQAAGIDNGTGRLFPLLGLFNADGSETLALDDIPEGGAFDPFNIIEFQAPASGSYVLAVAETGNDGTGGYAVAYDTFTAAAGDDVVGGVYAGRNPSLPVGGVFAGALDYDSDTDVIAVELEFGQVYRLAVAGSEDDPALSLGEPELDVLYEDGSAAIPAGAVSDAGVILYAPDYTGTHYLRVRPDVTFTGDQTGSYRVSAEAVAGSPDDFGIDLANAGALSVGDVQSGTITDTYLGPDAALGTVSDFDLFTVELTAGTAYSVDIAADADALIYVLDPDLAVLDGSANTGTGASDRFSGTSASFEVTAEQDGTHYLLVSAGRDGDFAPGAALQAGFFGFATAALALTADEPASAYEIAVTALAAPGPVTEETPPAEEQPPVEEAPAEEAPTVEETPAEEQPPVEEASATPSAGADLLVYGAEADTILPGLGADNVFAGAGDDTIRLEGGDALWPDGARLANENMVRSNGRTDSTPVGGKEQYHDVLDGGAGFDIVIGTNGHDVLSLSAPGVPINGADPSAARLVGIEAFDLGGRADVLDLTAADFAYTTSIIADGGPGWDKLWAGSGDDTLIGGLHGDYLVGGPGDDLLFGNRADGTGDGKRDLYGIADIADAGTDVVFDFEDGVDLLRVAGFGVRNVADTDLSLSQTDDGTLVTVSDQHTAQLFLAGIDVAQIDDSDFQFLA